MYSPQEIVNMVADRHGVCELIDARQQTDGEGNSFWEAKIKIETQMYGEFDWELWVTDLGHNGDIIDAESGECIVLVN